MTGFASTDAAWLLVVYGVGLVAGNMIGGRAADHDRDLTLLVSLAGLAATLAAFGLLAASRIASTMLVFAMGVFGFASSPGMPPEMCDGTVAYDTSQ